MNFVMFFIVFYYGALYWIHFEFRSTRLSALRKLIYSVQKQQATSVLSTWQNKNLFCLQYPDTHRKINTGTCRSARTSKPVFGKLRLHVSKSKTPYDEKQTSKETKYDTAGYENPKPLCGKSRTCTRAR